MSARPHQRRRRGPVVVIVALLLVAAVATWSVVLSTAGRAAGGPGCPNPASGPAPGQVLKIEQLASVAPVPPTGVKVKVLNAGGQRGQANLVAAQLGDLGFGQAAPPDNDSFFPDGDMECFGQIRFGPAGEAAASTLTVVLPCAELIRDGRRDAAVDVAVGTAFGDLNPGRAAKDALDQLGAPPSGSDGAANADPTGGGQAGSAAPAVDAATLAAARTCA